VHFMRGKGVAGKPASASQTGEGFYIHAEMYCRRHWWCVLLAR
jgi:hypothetical protein